MNKPLKQSVQQHLESYALTDDQLQKLESLSPQREPACTQKKSTFAFVSIAAVAAFLLVFLLTPLVIERGNVQERIALEVVTNHLKLKPMEIETSNIEEIRNYFTKLDFLPMNSRLVSDLGLELMGARYCSLQGITAAQFILKKPSSNIIQSLYQTEFRKDIFENMPLLEEGEAPVTIYVKGMKVKIWVEKGLLFAMTDLPESPE